MEEKNELSVPGFRGSVTTIRAGERKVPKKATKTRRGDSWGK
jgi:hypothetical protein